MSDPMQVGKVEFNRGESYGLHPTTPPKPPKRVAVELRAGANWTAVRSNDGIIYRWGYDSQDRGNRWTRLPDLPQE